MSVSEPDPQEVDPEVEALRAEAEGLGLKVHPRAKADTIRRKIAEHLADVAEEVGVELTDGDDQPERVLTPQQSDLLEQRTAGTGSTGPHLHYEEFRPARGPLPRTRSWVDQRGRRKTTRTGSELDRWYESAEHWKPA